MNKISLSREDLEEFAANDLGFYGLDISRISSIFIAQVMQMQANKVINTHQILDEVKFLEGLKEVSSTQTASAFNREPLKGLMKKHFTDARFIMKNLGAHFGYEFGGNENLKEVINKAFANNKSGYIDDEFIKFMAHESTVGAFQKRVEKKKVSGEWIVFKKYNGENYYLTLAAHDEGDENIYSRACDAYDLDFEFLRKSN
ncbi:hypothetical protein [Chromohalobacter canadensis]|uniref:Uncharacterized protein n=1 Tax=Chromohalobacter canadensis TaxID=141389 RepID=A0ABZ0YBW2_9GAMM|nr:hypothetical protein [Chromohalobacter canadensis]MCK0769983.1 hypothetical protein [Chromohalobacter canadensis]WQH09569.1 hypothetical protein SR908_02600 [Chromohalobacter canadensis]